MIPCIVSLQSLREIPSRTMGASSIFVITTPRALRIVPKITTLYESNSLNLNWADKLIVKGAKHIDFMKVLLPSGGGTIFLQVSISFFIKYESSALAASEYRLYISRISFIKGEPIFTTRSFMSMTILLKNMFLTKLLSISINALKTDLGLSFGSFDVNCLYFVGVIMTGFGIL